MTPRELAQHRANVMLQWAAGATVEHRFDASAKWSVIDFPSWNWGENEYRVKREPREFYLVSRPGMKGFQVCEADGGIPGDSLSCIHVREVID